MTASIWVDCRIKTISRSDIVLSNQEIIQIVQTISPGGKSLGLIQYYDVPEGSRSLPQESVARHVVRRERHRHRTLDAQIGRAHV